MESDNIPRMFCYGKANRTKLPTGNYISFFVIVKIHSRFITYYDIYNQISFNITIEVPEVGLIQIQKSMTHRLEKMKKMIVGL